LGRLLELQG
jgi:hypothetical protein